MTQSTAPVGVCNLCKVAPADIYRVDKRYCAWCLLPEDKRWYRVVRVNGSALLRSEGHLSVRRYAPDISGA